ncbi:MAG: metal ABC transporter ATP-binding protein [Spirochaetaceae bacterium]
MEEVASFNGVWFAYDQAPVIEDAEFAIGEGDFISVIGPNGAGKTTLAKLLLGLLKPQAGRIRVYGRSPQAARSELGYVPQYARFDPAFPVTVMDVALMGRLRPGIGPYRRQDREAAREALAEVRTADLATRPFSALSGGQRQRVLIARALAGNPRMLILDEPTANVDAAVESRLSTLLSELNERMTIVLITHDLGFVAESVRHVVCVNRRVRVHPTEEVTPDMISGLYGGTVRMVRHDRTEEAHG